ncbi:MAG: type II toxin-antitoxin system VapC family toxin [Micromonosporaceae bacterium]
MIVIDASAVVEVLLQTPKGSQVAAALSGQDVVAPELIDVEVLSVAARLVRSGELTAGDASDAVRLFRRMPVTRVSHSMLDQRAWDLRDVVRIPDAYYVACGEAFTCAVLTSNPTLARTALPGMSVLLVS